MAADAHVPQVRATPTVARASCADKGLGWLAVRNIALLTTEHW